MTDAGTRRPRPPAGLSAPRASAALMVAVCGLLFPAACAVGGEGIGAGSSATGMSSAIPRSSVTARSSRGAAAEPEAVNTILTATVAGVDVYPTPMSTWPASRLSNPNEAGAPRVFLVTARLPGWWQVLLPIWPNGSRGWIRDDQVRASTTAYHLQVVRGAHQLRLYRGNTLISLFVVAVGTTDTPTPGGRYYLTELLRPRNPTGPYGPFAFGLSGFSTSLASFEGHAPIIGLHGTDQPHTLGRDVSHGCIRLSNSDITWLAGMLPLGTPVDIVA
ncbi:MULTISPECIES: L,D-transpeptidase [unclassified Frankia]|uniref:L,D-transpeptidase n=1 Tax=unclassified Frankia TaxID=2632575 RepID=UPI000053C6E7|nr:MULTISPECIES: L,D-transpeptidase [unclassified Frankia]